MNRHFGRLIRVNASTGGVRWVHALAASVDLLEVREPVAASV